jgi:flagellar L-ring protein FlgH
MTAYLKSAFLITSLGVLSGCAALDTMPPTSVHQPMSVRPMPGASANNMGNENGAIYQTAQVRPLFEDRRSRMPGDTLTINLTERNNAQKGSNSTANRSSSIAGGITASNKLPLGGLAGMNIEAGMDSGFEGGGSTAANNLFNGTITVTVIEVYPNGNLLVSGEKQMTINQGQEFIRFSGVVNPRHITGANTVQSTQVADARIEYKGSGYIDEHQRIGWLQRFFVALMPF